MTIKSNPCKLCSSTYHTAAFCPMKPKKPIKRTAIKSNVNKIPNTVSIKKKIETKKKVPTRSQLVKKLDAIYSQYVRLDQSDQYGYCICVTSGIRMFWTEAQNGHFFSRRFYPTRWNDDNCHPQSMRDNVFLKGNYINYTRYMIDSYGRKFVDELEKLAHTTIKVKNAEIIEKIAHYTTEVERLKREKGL